MHTPVLACYPGRPLQSPRSLCFPRPGSSDVMVLSGVGRPRCTLPPVGETMGWVSAVSGVDRSTCLCQGSETERPPLRRSEYQAAHQTG